MLKMKMKTTSTSSGVIVLTVVVVVLLLLQNASIGGATCQNLLTNGFWCYPCETLSFSAVAAYRLEEANSTVTPVNFPNFATNQYPFQKNVPLIPPATSSPDVTFQKPPAPTQPSCVDGSFPNYYSAFFDGASYITVPWTQAFQVVTQSFTAEVWVYPTPPPSNVQPWFRSPFSLRGNSIDFSQLSGWNFYLDNNNNWEFLIGSSIPGQYMSKLLTSEPVVYNQWYHLVGTFDHGVQKLYVNGALVASTSGQPFNGIKLRPSLVIGALALNNGTANTYSANWLGCIDEPSYYPNIVLSDAQVCLRYTGNFYQTCS